MFVTFQIPIADLRPFLAEETGRLGAPGWPNPQVDIEFVRSVGVARERRRGGASPWTGEGYYASAARALRFPPGFVPWPYAGTSWVTPLRCLHRKFFSDGRAVSRLEVGFGPHAPRRPTDLPTPERLLGMLSKLLSLPVNVPDGGGRDLKQCELVAAGPALARHLLSSTTGRGSASPSRPWWMRALRPTVVISYREGELAALPLPAKRIAIAGGPGIFHLVASHNGLSVPVLLVPERAAGGPERARMMRLHLFRLHAEREVLKWTLGAIAQGRLADARSPASDRLQRYLSETLTLLERGTIYGIGATDELRSALRLSDLVNPGDREGLLVQLAGIRGNVMRKVEAAPAEQNTQPHISIGQLLVEGDMVEKNTRIDTQGGAFQGFVGDNNRVTESFQWIDESGAGDDLKGALKELVAAVETMKGTIDQPDAEAASRDLEAMLGETTAAAPRRDRIEAIGDALVQTAKKVGEVGLPVIAVIAKLVALFG